MTIRNVTESDYEVIISVLNEWWGGRNMADMLPRLFFKDFSNTSFIVEEQQQVLAFLIGFQSQKDRSCAYVHFLGIHPAYRGRGLGRRLHQVFSDTIKPLGCKTVHLVTSPVNKSSIAFHAKIGFSIEDGDEMVSGVAVHKNYDGPGEDRVLFIKAIH